MMDSKVVLVTGAAKRIGASIVRTFHANGYRVLIHARSSKNDATALCSELNKIKKNSAGTIYADFDSHDETQKLAVVALSHFGRIDVLINNASMFYPSPLLEAKPDDWNSLFNSNVKAAFFLSQALASELTKRHGCIINIIDAHADKPFRNHVLYNMAKSALKSMTKTLSLEMAPQVRVNGISPGAILWPEALEQEIDDEIDRQKAEIYDSIPMKRIGSEKDISNLAYFFAERAQYITGQIIKVDGGRSLG